MEVREYLSVSNLSFYNIYPTSNSSNLIATTRLGNPNDTLLLGAHADSVAEGPGINDNGSGAATLLELAIQLARHRTRSRVRFAFWTEEEHGLLGSFHYTRTIPQRELHRTRLYLNLDMLASPNYKLERHLRADVPGSQHAADALARSLAAQGLSCATRPGGGGSDHRPFEWAGVPASALTTGSGGRKTAEEARRFGGVAGAPYDGNYHTAEDTVANINQTALEVMATAVADVLATYARGFDGFPARDVNANITMSYDDVRYMRSAEKRLC